MTVDIFFIADIFLQFRTAYWRQSGSLEVDAALIRQTYFRRWFAIDFVSSLPLNYISYFFRGEMSELHALKSLRLLRLFKLLRLARSTTLSLSCHRLSLSCYRPFTVLPCYRPFTVLPPPFNALFKLLRLAYRLKRLVQKYQDTFDLQP